MSPASFSLIYTACVYHYNVMYGYDLIESLLNLLFQLFGSQWFRGERMKKPTTSDIARMAGTSRTTVSYILNNVKNKSISKETYDRVMNAVKQLDYRPNYFAKGLRTSLSKTVAIILPSITDPTIPIMVKGAGLSANLSEYSLIIHDNENIGKSKLDTIETICERAVDGIIYAYPNDTDDKAMIEHIVKNRRIPTVVIGKKYDEIGANSVRLDYFKMGEIMGEHLCRLGHRKIALISTEEMTSVRKMRIDGLNSALANYGIVCDYFTSKIPPMDVSMFYDIREYEGGRAATANLINQGLEYTALIGTNSMTAAGVQNVLTSRGIAIPDRISVCSFGGSFTSEVLEPKLTIVDIPFYDIGKTAFAVLHSVMENKENEMVQDIVFKPKLIVRNSTGPVPAIN